MKCGKCGTTVPSEAAFCPSCANPLPQDEDQHLEAPQVSGPSSWKVLAILVVVFLLLGLLAAYLYWGGESNPSGNGGNSATLVITLVYPWNMNSSSCPYVLYLNGEYESNGSIPGGESVTITRSYTLNESALSVLVHVELPGRIGQPQDESVILSRGETEQLTIVLPII